MSKVHVGIEMSESEAKEIDDLVEETQSGSRAALLSNAFSMLRWAVEQKKRGKIIAAIDEHTETYKVVVIPALERVNK